MVIDLGCRMPYGRDMGRERAPRHLRVLLDAGRAARAIFDLRARRFFLLARRLLSGHIAFCQGQQQCIIKN